MLKGDNMKQAKALAVVTFGLLVVGCSSLNHDVTINKFDYMGNNKLYANIEIIDGKYYLSNINNVKGDYLLNDLSPTFAIDEQDCGKWSYNTPYEDEGIPCDYKETHFRELKSRKGDTIARNAFLTVASLGTGVVKMAALGINYKYSYFDEEKYRQGITEAFTNAGIDRKDLLEAYDKWLNGANRFAEMYNNYFSRYNELGKNITLKPNIIDKSGYYNNEDITKLVVLNQNPIPEKNVNNIDLQAKQVMEYFKSQDLQIQNYEKNLSELTSFYYLSFNKNGSFNKYNYTIEAPESVKAMNTKQTIPYTLTLNNASFGRVYPYCTISDKNITLASDGKKIDFENNTKEFIQIHSISLYLNDDIKTLVLGEPIELPPHSKTKKPIDISQVYDYKMVNILDQNNITAEQAKKKNITYGFAVKYRMVEQNIDKTLYKTNIFNIHELLKKQI